MVNPGNEQITLKELLKKYTDYNSSDEVICPAVWDHLCVNTMGKNRLCCNSVTSISDNIFLDPNDTVKRLSSNELLRFSRNLEMDGRTLIAALPFLKHWYDLREPTRQAMMKGERPSVCQQCWHKEDMGMRSLRQMFISKYKRKGLWKDFKDRVQRNIIRETPEELDLKLGNFCNLSCRMCSGFSSSKVSAEYKKIKKETGVALGNDYEMNLKVLPWYDWPEFLDLLYYFINNGVRSIKFTGGEPLMVPNVRKVIEYCIETDKAKDLEFQIITNMTLLDESWMDLFREFRHVSINASIDGIGKTYEYIRKNANWTDVLKNLENLSNHENAHVHDKIVNGKVETNENKSIMQNITFTLSIYYILEAKNIIDLRRKLGCYLTCIPVFTPEYLDVKYAPELLKEDAIEILDSIDFMNITEQDFVKDMKAKITEKVDDTGHYYKVKDMQEEVVKVSLLRDKFRDQNWHDQDIAKYYS